ncbi:MAG: hypothetical protein H6741_18995 [Alphaproteobacteria bacterium]|nr:hypothetical protein [Alphaproteobacteria bacterium]MCB9794798.1 hypothetical protein [Alphaproteobacteria bacterium]
MTTAQPIPWETAAEQLIRDILLTGPPPHLRADALRIGRRIATRLATEQGVNAVEVRHVVDALFRLAPPAVHDRLSQRLKERGVPMSEERA